jgi:predicted dehydrogenase
MADISGPSAVILGSGFIAQRHIAALRETGVDVAGVFSPTSAHAAALATRWGTRAASSLDELLDLPGVTHAHVCSPTTLHEDAVTAIAERGLAVVCEKPLTVDGAGAARMRDLVRSAGVDAYLTFNRRFDEGIRAFRSLLRAGEIGEPVAIYGQYQQQWNAVPSSKDWRFDPSLVGASRVVSEIGSHWLDLASHLLGGDRIEAVSSITRNMGERTWEVGDESGTFTPVNEDMVASLLQTGDGVVGSILATQLAHGTWDDITLRIDGTLGSLSWDSRDASRVALSKKGVGVTMIGSGADSTSIVSMIASIYSGSDTECARFDDGVVNCAIQDAVLESASVRQWTTVKEYS